MRNIKGILIAILAIILLSGCSASKLIKMAKRKDPSLFITKIDTVRDTIFIEMVSVDTLFKYNFDTVTYYQDSVYVKYHYSVEDSLVYIEVDCPDQQIITETITEKETITIKPTFWEKLQWFAYALIGLVLFLGIKKIFT